MNLCFPQIIGYTLTSPRYTKSGTFGHRYPWIVQRTLFDYVPYFRRELNRSYDIVQDLR